MTKLELMRILRQAGCTFEEGAKHTLAISKDGTKQAAIPRHKGDLKKFTVKAILKELDLN